MLELVVKNGIGYGIVPAGTLTQCLARGEHLFCEVIYYNALGTFLTGMRTKNEKFKLLQ